MPSTKVQLGDGQVVGRRVIRNANGIQLKRGGAILGSHFGSDRPGAQCSTEIDGQVRNAALKPEVHNATLVWDQDINEPSEARNEGYQRVGHTKDDKFV